MIPYIELFDSLPKEKLYPPLKKNMFIKPYSIPKFIPSSIALLAIKAADNPITPSELSRRIHREAHSVHELVNRMEKDGLVIKVKDPRWSRKVIIELTPKGEEINTRARNSSIIKKIFSSLSTKERKNFYSYVEKLRLKTLTEFAISKEA